MTIERLQELKDMINQDYMTEDHYSYEECISEDGEDLISLIDEKISQLSVTDEDVQEAIEQCEYALEDEQLESDGEWSSATFSTTAINTMITALQAYRPVEVADDDVKRAIEYATVELKKANEAQKLNPYCFNNEWVKATKTILYALQQMQKFPPLMKDESGVTVENLQALVGEPITDYPTITVTNMRQGQKDPSSACPFGYQYCPKCGKKLES